MKKRVVRNKLRRKVLKKEKVRVKRVYLKEREKEKRVHLKEREKFQILVETH